MATTNVRTASDRAFTGAMMSRRARCVKAALRQDTRVNAILVHGDRRRLDS
jgi:hypothetical protein